MLRASDQSPSREPKRRSAATSLFAEPSPVSERSRGALTRAHPTQYFDAKDWNGQHPQSRQPPTPEEVASASKPLKYDIKGKQPEIAEPPQIEPEARPPTISRQPTLTDATELDRYEIGKLRRELVGLWNAERNVIAVLRNRIPADKKLKDFIKDRDIVSLALLFLQSELQANLLTLTTEVPGGQRLVHEATLGMRRTRSGSLSDEDRSSRR